MNKWSSNRKKQPLRRVRAKSAPALLKNPMTYYIGVPCLIVTAIVGYGLCRYFSGGEKGDVYKTGGKSGYETLIEWGLGEFKDILALHSFRVLDKKGFGKLVCVSRHFDGRHDDGGIDFEFYFRFDGKKDIIGNLFGVYCCYLAASIIFFDRKKFTTEDDAFEFWSRKCSDSKVDKNFTNIVKGCLLGPDEYFEYLCGKVDIDYSLEKNLFKAICSSHSGEFEKLRKALVKAGKEIYVNEKDGKLYLRNIKKKQ